MQGQTINGYTLQRRLGEGGMAEVWYAENEIGKPAAVKILKEELTNNEAVVERFHNEALVMVKLNHPNIRQVFGYGYMGKRHCIIMEYLEGKDLEGLMKDGKRFTDKELRKWWNQAAEALEYTHALGVVHRDIKPSNLFLCNDGTVKLLDFGIAKIMENASMTKTGIMMGTLMYMSPEQVNDFKRVDYRTDLYSLAVTFVHLITGEAPYNDTQNSYLEIPMSIVMKPLNMDKVPDAWRKFLTPYLEKKPEDRPALRPFEEKVSSPQKRTSDVGAKTIATEVPSIPKKDNVPTQAFQDAPSQKKASSSEEKEKSLSDKQSKTVAPKSKSKKGLWIALTLAALAAVSAILLLRQPKQEPTDSDTQAYEDCKTIADYRAYMHDYGRDATHYVDAKAFVDQYVIDSTTKALEKQKEEKAQEAVKQQEDDAYKKCTNIAACDSYLKTYPEGQYVIEVKNKKTALEEEAKAEAEAKTKEEAEKKEADAYKKCTTIAACDSYLKTYPKGQYVIEVKKKKVTLEEEAKTEAKAKEEAEKKEADAYKKCTTIAACDSYLNIYPQGSYVDKVRKKRDELAKAEATKPLVSVTGHYNGHDYVDLGLPSGTLWATCNVGASKPDGYGNFYAWGEIAPKEIYEWSNYKHANGNQKKLTKYCNKSDYGQNDFTDNLIVLQPTDDAASVNWGNGWRLPTITQWKELMQNTTSDAMTRNGVKGRLFVGPNGNSMFLPAAGYYDSGKQCSVDFGYYWSNSLCSDYPYRSWYFWFNMYPNGFSTGHESRKYGKFIRAVRSSH
ncbi:MAG: protein kinase [Bacteroidales bacterium]|nr:protein kinase [Bacteroidales bacterium]